MSLVKWGTKSWEDIKLIALRIQLKSINNDMLQLTKNLKAATYKDKAPVEGKMKKCNKSKKGQKKDEAWKKGSSSDDKSMSKIGHISASTMWSLSSTIQWVASLAQKKWR